MERQCALHEITVQNVKADIRALENKFPAMEEKLLEAGFNIKGIYKNINDIATNIRLKAEAEEKEAKEKGNFTQWLIGIIGIGILTIAVNLYTHFSTIKHEAINKHNIELAVLEIIQNASKDQ